MKKSALMCMCLGWILAGLTGCADELSKGGCGVGESGQKCDGDKLIVCASGMEINSMTCQNGCVDNMCVGQTTPTNSCTLVGDTKCENGLQYTCVDGFWGSETQCPNGCDAIGKMCQGGSNQTQTCTNAVNHCNADKTKVVKCDGGNEVDVEACPNGCDDATNACKQAQPEGCTETANHCNADKTKLVKCVDGAEVEVEVCPNGCDVASAGCIPSQVSCTETANHCNADKSKIVKCEDGNEVDVEACPNGCDEATNACKQAQPEGCTETANHCNADKSKVVKCEDGNEVDVEACPNGCDEASASCIEGDIPECNWTGKDCDENMDNVMECTDGKLKKVKECSESQMCFMGECIDLDELEESLCDGTETGLKCLGNSVVKCKKSADEDDRFDIVESCIGKCTNGVCDEVACPPNPQPSCFDTVTKLSCDANSGKMKKEACPDGESCVSGECFNKDQVSSCNFDKACSADGSSIKVCKEGKVTYETCKVKYYCDDSGDEPVCKSAMISNDLNLCDEDHFVSACDGDKTAYTCDSGSLNVDHCNKNETCVSGLCRTTTNKKIGDSCSYGNFDDTCIDNTPVTCDSKTKKITVIDGKSNCSLDGSICGSVESSGVQMFDCFEPCEEKGGMLNRCITSDDTAYQTSLECVDLGNGQWGLDHINVHYDACDMGCKEGKCVDYTSDVEDIGKSCNPDQFDAYCKDSGRAVTCEGENGSEVVMVEVCSYNESCTAFKKFGEDDAVDCLKQCQAGDPETYECGGASFITSTKFECQNVSGQYVYVPMDIELCGSSLESCGDDGKCVK